jgi:hypothetical protein
VPFVDKTLATRYWWNKLFLQTIVPVAVIVGFAVTTIPFDSQTIPARHSRTGGPPNAALALPCRHQMIVSSWGPACSAAARADVITAAKVAARRLYSLDPWNRPCSNDASRAEAAGTCSVDNRRLGLHR